MRMKYALNVTVNLYLTFDVYWNICVAEIFFISFLEFTKH